MNCAPPELDNDTFARAVARVRAEFMEMPGLTLTLPQAVRLWALDTAMCTAVLSALVEARFLTRTRCAAFSRAE